MLSSVSLRPKRTVAAIIVGVIGLVLLFWFLRSDNRYWNDLYVMQYVKSKLYNNQTSNLQQLKRYEPVKRHKNSGLILDTPGCRIPKLDPFDHSIMDLYVERDEPYPCPGPPLFMKSKPDGSITLNASALQTHYQVEEKDISCTYEAIRRLYEKDGNVRENDYEWLSAQALKFDVPLEEDYVKVTCDLNKKETFYHYFPLVRLKAAVEEKKTPLQPPTPHLNVILAGVDSISKLQFLRHFRRTHDFIKKKGTFFDMKGYVKVGDNTFPNINPLLTGRFVQDIWNETVKDTMYFDNVDMIWKRYAKKGYRTFYAEDSPHYGTYNYGRRGFNETPTDYYIRPMYLAIHNSEVRQKGPFYCFNSQLETDFIYDYLKDFVRAMDKRPFFAFAMVSSLTHDYINHAGYADFPTVKLLEDLWEIGADNNTIVVLFGDHGLRFGAIKDTYLGKYEERMPFMYIHFPKWFLEQYPEVGDNLRVNQERLITLFDVHATLVQMLNPLEKLSTKEKATSTPYGLSLIDEISPYRSCEKASIYTHWCTCQVIQEVSVYDSEILKSAVVTMDCLNHELRLKESCPLLELDNIVVAKLGQLNDLVLRYVKHENVAIDRNVVYGDRIVKYEDFVLTILTKPNGELFESTVRHDVTDDSYCVVDIFQISSQKQESSCINFKTLKKYKYCSS